MGYTHYWSMSRDFTDKEWRDITVAARRIVNYAQSARGIALSKEYDINRIPVIGSTQIRFNGYGEEGHETSHLTRKVGEPPEYRIGQPDFQFCKTARKPYDDAVVAILLFARHTAPDVISWSSDGWLAEHADGLDLLGKACGLDLEWSNATPDDNDPDRSKVTNVVSLDHARDLAS